MMQSLISQPRQALVQHSRACQDAAAVAAVKPVVHRPQCTSVGLTGHMPLHCQVPSSARFVACRFKEESAEPMPTLHSKPMHTTGRQVVLAVDNTPESEQAVVWAVHNLLKSGDTVHIYHVVPGGTHQKSFNTPSSHVITIDTSMDDAHQRVHDNGVQMARQLIGRYGPRLAKMQVVMLEASPWLLACEEQCIMLYDPVDYASPSWVPFEAVQLQAHVVPVTGMGGKNVVGHVLCDQAAALNASAVVLASRSHGGLQELIHGSVADFVIHHCTCPVAVLHLQPPAPRTTPTTTTTQHISTTPGANRQLVVAVDDTQDSLTTCRWILDNMYHQGDTIHMVHVVPCLPLNVPFTGSDFLVHPGIQSEPSMLALEEEVAEKEAQEWKTRQARPFVELMQKAGAQYTFDIMVHHTEDPVMAIAGSINSKADELRASAVVLCHHDRSAITQFMLGSVSNQVAHHCNRPVVVMHGRNTQRAAAV